MERFERLRSVLDRVIELDATSRSAVLDAECRDDPELRREVESILGVLGDVPAVLATDGAADVLGASVTSSHIGAGSRLGPYEVEERVGAGGMGVVYRARDTRLDRSVAIKVLPTRRTRDPDYQRRLTREARAIGKLQHPGICTLHDIGHGDGFDYLVLEYLRGETLATRLGDGPMSVIEALDVAMEIASALDAAHRAGVVHRDLKPSNVMLTSSGVKLLDFGVAKLGARSVLTASRRRPDESGFSELAASSLTRQGTILGTFPYMAPEQLEGKDVDARTDIFALGAVLYEMVTGRRAFLGEGASLVAAIIATDPPPVRELVPEAPVLLDPILTRCLAKDPDDRLQTAHDVRIQFEWARELAAGGGHPVHERRRIAGRLGGLRRVGSMVLAVGIVAALAGGAAWIIRGLRTEPPRVATRFQVPPPADAAAAERPRISPDGRRLAFIGTDSLGTDGIWLRELEEIGSRRLGGTDHVDGLTWAPDSRRIAFMAEGKMLRLVDTVTGRVRTVSELFVEAPRSKTELTWDGEDHIVFDRGSRSPLYGVSVSGGAPTPWTVLDTLRHEIGHSRPATGSGVLTFIVRRDGAPRRLAVRTASGEPHRYLEQTESRGLVLDGSRLLYLRRHTLMARPIDLRAGVFTGDPFPVAENVLSARRQGAEFCASGQGTLVYRAWDRPGLDLVWIDRDGRRIGVALESGEYRFPALSPDGERLAVARSDALGNRDIWLHDGGSAEPRRITFRVGNDNVPTWSADGQEIIYLATVPDTSWILRHSVSGVGKPDTLVTSPAALFPLSCSPDGRYLVYTRFDDAHGSSLRVLSLTEPGPDREFFNSRGESRAQISPDGDWLVYESDQSGSTEIYIQAFPEGGSQQQLTLDGGATPFWTRGGAEIVYLSGADMMSLDVRVVNGAIEVGEPRRLFTVRDIVDDQYTVTPDGERFLFVSEPRDAATVPMTVVLNWQSLLDGSR